MEKLVIYGASGHGKVVADIASNYYKQIMFFDDDKTKEQCMGYPVVNDRSQMEEYVHDSDFFVGIGNARVRKEITLYLTELGADFATLIHPSAIIGKHVKVGKGTVIMPGVIVNADSKIGEGCIVNTAASIDHDCNIADYVHVSVGAHLCGTVEIGEKTWVGAGAVIINNTKVCEECMIGAGAVVVGNITEDGTYVGVPARKVEKK